MEHDIGASDRGAVANCRYCGVALRPSDAVSETVAAHADCVERRVDDRVWKERWRRFFLQRLPKA